MAVLAAITVPAMGDWGVEVNFPRNLTVGSKGTDVLEMKAYLKVKGYLRISDDKKIDYFGPETKRALAAFQVANGITPANGYFGPITRTKMIEIWFQ